MLYIPKSVPNEKRAKFAAERMRSDVCLRKQAAFRQTHARAAVLNAFRLALAIRRTASARDQVTESYIFGQSGLI